MGKYQPFEHESDKNDAYTEEIYTAYNTWQSEPSKGFSELYSLAGKGSIRSIFYVACGYRDGLGVEVDEKLAETFFSQAHDSGYALASYNLGRFYLDREKYQRAFDVLSISEKLKYPPILSCLGYMYMKGYGIEKQLDRAKILFEESSELGNIWAKRRLSRVLMTGKYGVAGYIRGVFLKWVSIAQGAVIYARDPSDERFFS